MFEGSIDVYPWNLTLISILGCTLFVLIIYIIIYKTEHGKN